MNDFGPSSEEVERPGGSTVCAASAGPNLLLREIHTRPTDLENPSSSSGCWIAFESRGWESV